MPLPNFIIIGAMKAGTSTLHSNLQLHPEIGMSKFKEPSYFNLRYKNNDLEWYANQFSENKKINGESSPNYSKKHLFPGTAERMYNALPQVKLIYLTREPIKRVISHLHHNLYRDRLSANDIHQTLEKDRSYILTSKYMSQLEEYLLYFERSQFLFITTEELQSDLNGTLNKICKFLEVEEFNFSNNLISRNQSSEKYLIKKYDLAKKHLPRRGLKIYHWFFYFIKMKIKKPELSNETMRDLKEALIDDTLQYAVYTEIETKRWDILNSTQSNTK